MMAFSVSDVWLDKGICIGAVEKSEHPEMT